MKEKIIQVIFDGWCSGEFGVDREVDWMTAGVIADIGEHFQAAGVDQNYIDTQVMRAVCVHERSAFMAGLRIGLALITGSLWAAK